MDYTLMTVIFLNAAIAGIFFFSIFEDRVKPNLPIFNNTPGQKKQISIKNILILLLIFFPLTLLLLLKGQRNYLEIFTFILFSICIVFHAWWISYAVDKKYRLFVYLFAGLVIVLRYLLPYPWIHNIFLALVVVWLGPFITSIHRFLSQRIFIGASVLWFFYDIYYVWVSSTVTKLNIATQPIAGPAKFSLSFVVFGESIGLADLFFAVLLLAMLHHMRSKLVACGLFIVTNILLEIYVYTTGDFNVFPLLVLWVPVGLYAFYLDRTVVKKNTIASV